MPLSLGAMPAPANNSREMEERQFIGSFMSFLNCEEAAQFIQS
jgi:hypothetical protein